MSNSIKPETLAQQQEYDSATVNYLKEATASRAAEAIVGNVDTWSELRGERQNLPGIRNVFKSVRLKSQERRAERSIETKIKNLELQISSIEQRQSSYLSRRFLSYAQVRAPRLGMNRMAEELKYELGHTPHETYDRMQSDWGWWGFGINNQALNQERRLYSVIVDTANLIASPKDKGKITCQLSTGSGNTEHNSLVRASLGFGSQGESHADLTDATKLLSLIGVNDHSGFPTTLPELGHFSLGMPVLASFSGNQSQMPGYEDTDFQLNFKFKYNPEHRRSSGEDVVYVPDSLEVVVSKVSLPRPKDGKGLPIGVEELAVAKS
jgi:hypothetical protein